MTERNIESLSAYIDGDLQDEKFLDTLCNDSELQEKWHRYHIIKDGLKKESPSVLNFDISAQVMQALDDEPALSVSETVSELVSEPDPVTASPAEPEIQSQPITTEIVSPARSKTVSIGSWLARQFAGNKASNDDSGNSGKASPLFQQTGQFAVAASVAVAVILGVQQYNQPVEEQPFNAAPTIPVTGIQGGLSPVSLEQTRALPRPDVSVQRQRLNAYLNDHNQQVRRKSTADSSFEVNSENDKQADQERKNPEK